MTWIRILFVSVLWYDGEGLAQTLVLETFDSGASKGSVRAGTTWVGNVTQNASTITVGGSARDDNGWGATGQAINATGMGFIAITGQRDSGNAAANFAIQFEDRNLNTQVFSVSASAFAAGVLTQVQITIGSWAAGFDPAQITSWSIGGGSLGLAAFRMTLDQISFSATAVSGVAVAPVVTGDFSARTRAPGESITFTVTATGTAPLTYQWFRNGTTPLAGNPSATAANLTLTNLTALDAGTYTCTVTNAAGSATSGPFTLTVTATPATVILSNLAATYTGAARTATATTTPAGLPVAITYNGSATAPVDAGSYAVVATVTDPGYTGRAEGTLVVAKAAQSIAFAPLPATIQVGVPFTVSATATSGGPVVLTVTQGNATLAGAAVTPRDTAAVILRATQAGDANYNATTTDLAFTTSKRNQSIDFAGPPSPVLSTAPITLTATASSGLPVQFSLISGPATLAGATLNPTGSGVIVVRASQPGSETYNAASNIDRSLTVTLPVVPVPPTILAAPTSHSAAAGTPVTLAVSAGGDTPLTYQWLKDGTALAGATGAVLAISRLATTDSGSYRVEVRNAAGSATAGPFTLTVTTTLATISLANLATTYTGTARIATATTTPRGLPTTITYNGSAAAPVSAGSYTVVATVSDPAYTGRAEGTLVVAKAAQSIAISPLPATIQVGVSFPVTATATSGGPVVLTIVRGNATINGTTVTPNDAVAVTLRATQAGDANYDPATTDLVFATGKQNQSIDFAALPASAPSTASIALAATANSGLPVTFSVVSGPARISGTALTFTASGTVVVRASQPGSDTYSAAPDVDRSLTILPAPPTILAAPGSRTVAAGTALTLSVSVGGDGPLAYQWFKDSRALAGATGAALAIARASTADAGTYRVEVSNAVGSTTSEPFTLTVTTTPATVALSNLATTYSGTARTATVTTTPADLPVAITYNGSSTAPVNAGSYAVVATVSDPAYTGRAEGTLVVAKAAQSIAFAPLPTTIREGVAFAVGATASSGGPVGFSIQQGNATIDVTTVTVRNNTTVTLRATQAGNANYNAATADLVFTVGKQNQNIDFPAPPGTPPLTLAATATSGLPVSFRVVSGPATIAGANLTATGSGVVVIRASQAGNDTFNAAPDVDRTMAITLPTTTAPPAILDAPAGSSLAVGDPLRLSVSATGGGPLVYQWFKDGRALAGATEAVLSIAHVAAPDAGSYHVEVSNAGGSSRSAAVVIAVVTPRFVNFSTRARAGIMDQVAIAGFVIAGDQPKSVLIRAVGPTLAGFGVNGVVNAPKLELFRGGILLGTNTGWTTGGAASALATAAARAGAFALGANTADAALLATLTPGNYTAVISAADGQPGVGLVEVYDLSDAAAGRGVSNLSVRALSGAGADTLIVGVVVQGPAPKRMLIRAVGPGLAQFGVSGELTQTRLAFFSETKEIARNAGWSSSPDAAAIAQAATQVGAFPLAPASLDSALIVNLPPGAYTTQVSGEAGAAGVALVEVYELP